MVIKYFPKKIREHIIDTAGAQGNWVDEKSDLSHGTTMYWENTKEGHKIWQEVNNCNYEPLYKFRPDLRDKVIDNYSII